MIPEAVRDRLVPVVARWDLPPDSLERLGRLLTVLAEDPHAPTSVRDPVRGVDVHVADSLSGLGVAGLRRADRVVDIGTGAGFPGLVLAAAMSNTTFDLLEAVHRKCEFVERVRLVLALETVAVICRRAEQWAAVDGAGAYDAAVVRAVGSLSTVLEYAAPLLRVGGSLVVWKGRRDRDEEGAAEVAAERLGMRFDRVEWVGPFAGSRNRHLHVWEKAEATPLEYPRRPGMAKKRPLGGH